MICLEGIYKNYGKNNNIVKALNNINLAIDDKEMIAIVGQSGCGKTSLINIIGLVDKDLSGKYMLNSKDALSLSEKEKASLRNKNFGFIFQDFALVEHYTVLQNIELPLIYSKEKYSKIQRKEKVQDICRILNIEEKINSNCHNLSGGQRQRVAIGRAIINNPNIILADEPTGALDSKTSNDIMNIFLELNKKGKTIIIVTHNLEIAARCRRIIEMKDGEIIRDNK